jgi:hypothetical protein
VNNAFMRDQKYYAGIDIGGGVSEEGECFPGPLRESAGSRIYAADSGTGPETGGVP